jgi:hypothetical protein
VCVAASSIVICVAWNLNVELGVRAVSIVAATFLIGFIVAGCGAGRRPRAVTPWFLKIVRNVALTELRRGARF